MPVTPTASGRNATGRSVAAQAPTPMRYLSPPGNLIEQLNTASGRGVELGMSLGQGRREVLHLVRFEAGRRRRPSRYVRASRETSE
jgi:hypothetical protein